MNCSHAQAQTHDISLLVMVNVLANATKLGMNYWNVEGMRIKLKVGNLYIAL